MEELNMDDKVPIHMKLAVDRLNFNNLYNSTIEIIAQPARTIEQLENMTDYVLTQALKRQYFTSAYAQLCTSMINHLQFNEPEGFPLTFKQILLEKWQSVFFSYRTYQQDLEKIIYQFKHSTVMTPRHFKNALFKLQFGHYNKSVANCIFISELYIQQTINEKIILLCLKELSNAKEDLQVYCLCMILKKTGSKLSKVFGLDDVVKNVLLFKNEYSIDKQMPQILEYMITEIINLHSNDWIVQGKTEPSRLKSYTGHNSDKSQWRKICELNSYNIMAANLLEECYDVLFSFVSKIEITEQSDLSCAANKWVNHDQLSFATAMILVAIEEEDWNNRTDAGKLLDSFVQKKILSIDFVRLGVRKVHNDTDIKIKVPNLSSLILDIIRQFK